VNAKTTLTGSTAAVEKVQHRRSGGASGAGGDGNLSRLGRHARRPTAAEGVRGREPRRNGVAVAGAQVRTTDGSFAWRVAGGPIRRVRTGKGAHDLAGGGTMSRRATTKLGACSVPRRPKRRGDQAVRRGKASRDVREGSAPQGPSLMIELRQCMRLRDAVCATN
jgi:hypothetical protein